MSEKRAAEEGPEVVKKAKTAEDEENVADEEEDLEEENEEEGDEEEEDGEGVSRLSL